MQSHFTHRRKFLQYAAAAPLAIAGVGARANSYPSRPVKVIAPFAAGAALDMIARRVSQDLSTRLGQPFIVENRVGANGQLGTNAVARAPADGYTLLATADSAFSIPSLTSARPYDPVRDFQPLSMTCELSLLLFASASFPASTLDELIAYAKTEPGKVSYGSFGIGSQSHLFMEQLGKRAGIEMLNVPYGGVAPIITALLGGDQIGIALQGVPGALPHLRTGKLKAIAYAGAQRHPLLPNVPTFTEAGMPNFSARAWHGLFAPRGLPADVTQILSRTTWENVTSKEYANTLLIPNGFDPKPSISVDRFPAFVAEEQKRYEVMMKELNLKPMERK